jgi:hypothetical protein
MLTLGVWFLAVAVMALALALAPFAVEKYESWEDEDDGSSETDTEK